MSQSINTAHTLTIMHCITTGMLFPICSRQTFSAIIRYLPSGLTCGRFELSSPSWQIYGCCTEAETAIRALAKSFPREGKGRVMVSFSVSLSYDVCCRGTIAFFCHLCTSLSDGQYHITRNAIHIIHTCKILPLVCVAYQRKRS